jgi:SAM-dependent methyltransferase
LFCHDKEFPLPKAKESHLCNICALLGKNISKIYSLTFIYTLFWVKCLPRPCKSLNTMQPDFKTYPCNLLRNKSQFTRIRIPLVIYTNHFFSNPVMRTPVAIHQTNPYLINDKNLGFYDRIDIDNFQDFAKKVGLETGRDIDFILPDLLGVGVVVELGSGYGRALQLLLAKGLKTRLFGVERVEHLVHYIRHRLGDQLEILQQDIKHLQLPLPADRILWLWSGILELSPVELLETLKNLYTQMANQSVLYLETPHEIKFIGQQEGEHYVSYEAEWGRLEAYLPNECEMDELIKIAGFQHCEILRYKTTNEVDRLFYKITKMDDGSLKEVTVE